MLRSLLRLSCHTRRVLRGVVMTSVLSCSVFGQTYTIETVAGGGLPLNITGPSSSLGRIEGVATDRNGNVFMTVPDYAVVVRWDAATGLLTLVAGNGNGPGVSSGDNGPATRAQFDNPSGIAVDTGGNLYIADAGRIRQVSNGVVTTVAGGGTVSPGDNGPATDAQLNSIAGIAVDAAGSLYIAARNRIRKVSNGVITTVAGNGTAGFSGDTGPAAGAQLNNPSGIAVDSGGDIYVADVNNHVVRRIADGVITTIAGNGKPGFSGDSGPANGAQLSSPSGIALDASGNLYITDRGNNRIRKVSNGTITTVAGGAVQYSPPPDASCAPYPAGVVPFTSVSFLSFPNSAGDRLLQGGLANFEAVNNLPLPAIPDQAFCGSVQLAPGYSVQAYVPTVAERNGDFKGFGAPMIDPMTGFPFAGNVIPSVLLRSVYAWRIRVDPGDNGPATASLINIPHGIAIDPTGLLYVADYGNYRVRRVANGVITTVAGNGTCCFTGDGGPAGAARLGYPAGLAIGSAGSLYIGGDGVREISNGVITTVATGAQVGNPSAIAIDPGDNLYVAQMYDYQIRKVSNGVITTVEWDGKLDFGSDNDPFVTGVAVDSAGSLFLADSGTNRVLKLSDGVMTTVAGSGGFGFSGDGGPATSAQLNNPVALAIDSDDALYIADSGNRRIRKVRNGVITTVAGDGTKGFGGDNGPATSAQFDSLTGIAIDLLGNLYIADRNNPRLRMVSSGVITTIAGTGSVGFAGDNGPASDAVLGSPRDVAVDATGKVYFSDTAGNRIRALVPVSQQAPTRVSPVLRNWRKAK